MSPATQKGGEMKLRIRSAEFTTITGISSLTLPHGTRFLSVEKVTETQWTTVRVSYLVDLSKTSARHYDLLVVSREDAEDFDFPGYNFRFLGETEDCYVFEKLGKELPH